MRASADEIRAVRPPPPHAQIARKMRLARLGATEAIKANSMTIELIKAKRITTGNNDLSHERNVYRILGIAYG